jgi:sugar lactone lactonase YvrE
MWWTPPSDIEGVVPTGLAYEPSNNAILVTDSEQNTVYRLGISDTGASDGVGTLLYRYTQQVNFPSFTGITVAPDGTIYIAALAQNGVVRLEDDDITYIAGNFRGANDVAAAPDGRLYVANFDARALVVPLVRPQLPFAIGVIEINTES